MDIIVTTPKRETNNAVREAEVMKLDGGGGRYFRRLARKPDRLFDGDRIFYVEDGFVRGFGVVDEVSFANSVYCDITDRSYSSGWFVFYYAQAWHWIKPIPMGGFQGFRYTDNAAPFRTHAVEVIGGWLDPKPEAA